MIAIGNHGNSDSLRGAPLPAVKLSNFTPHFGKLYRVLGRHECLPYSKDGTCLEIYKHQFIGLLSEALCQQLAGEIRGTALLFARVYDRIK